MSEYNSDARGKRRKQRGRPFAAPLCTALVLLGGCGPSVQTVLSTTDQTELANIAVGISPSEVRCAAVKKLTDQTLLATIAVEDKNRDVRCAAVGKLADQALLMKIAVEDEDRDIRGAAVGKLADQALLATVAIEGKDKHVCDAAVGKLTDQTLLARIAIEGKDDHVRGAAVDKLTDQIRLAKSAVEDPGPAFRASAPPRADQALPAKLPAEVKDEHVRGAALEKDKLTQTLLAKIAIEADDFYVRNAAAEELDDVRLLVKLAVETKDGNLRRKAVEKVGRWTERTDGAFLAEISDQALLGDIAVEAENHIVRFAALKKLTDRAVLAKMGMWVKPELTRQVTDQGLLAQIAVDAKDEYVRAAAVEKLADQALLARIAMDDKADRVRDTALGKLAEPTLLKIAAESKSLNDRCVVIGKMRDQALLRQWAVDQPQAVIREAAVRRITDDGFLIKRLRTEQSATVRAAVIETLHEKAAMRQAAIAAYRAVDRGQASRRLEKILGDVPRDVSAAHDALNRRVEALEAETDNDKLTTVVLEGELDVLCATAARRLTDPAALEKAALRANDRDVLKVLLAKVADKAVLTRIASSADDRAMRLAAMEKAGTKSWEEIFRDAAAAGATTETVGDAIAAVSLFVDGQPNAKKGAEEASLSLIRRGDESRIPEMVDLLEVYGDQTLAEDYLNCAQPDLAGAAQDWAHRHGLSVGRGYGSSRATWGSGR